MAKNTDQTNTDLASARKNKSDEFYTAYKDVSDEISLYPKSEFMNKVVYCPCDNYKTSNFYKFFKDNYQKFNLKKLIATSYNENGKGTIIEKTWASESVRELSGNGDFQSDECKSILKSSDIIVTNPPFSLFRKFIQLLIDYNKKFIILGNINGVTYREVFKHIVEKTLQLGGSIHSGDREFEVPDEYPLDGIACRVSDDGKKYIRVKGVRWFTNMNYKHLPLKHTILKECYSEENYPKYDTYDAINVNTMKEIPIDYYGIMGVPITVIDKMNPNFECEFKDINDNIIRFEIIGQLNSGNNQNYDFTKPIIDGKCKFKRLLVKRI